MANSPVLGLELMASNQSQKHVTHNDNMLRLDILVQSSVIDRDLSAPPGSPADGDHYIVGPTATGLWAGKEDNLANWMNAGWVFFPPEVGWLTYVQDEGLLLAWSGTAWVPLPQVGSGESASVALSHAGANTSTAQPVFASAADTLALRGGSTYEFEAVYLISRAAGTTSHTTSLLFGGTAVLADISYLATVSNPTGNALGAVQQIRGDAATAVVVTAANTSATEDIRVTIQGVVRVTTAGSIIPQFQYSAAPGGAPTILPGTRIKFRLVGSSTVESYGPGWS